MGMSASQARYIALTARMADTEYEAQQVNQQRLTLSNKMNEVYESLVNMDVPTPPSKQDYITYNYSGKTNGGKEYKVKTDGNGVLKFQSGRIGETVKYAGNFTKGEKITKNCSPLTDFTPEGRISKKIYSFTTNPEEYKAYISEQNQDFVNDGAYFDDKGNLWSKEDEVLIPVQDIPVDYTDENAYSDEQINSLLGCYVKVGSGIIMITEDNIDSYVDKANGTLKIDVSDILKEDKENGEPYTMDIDTDTYSGCKLMSIEDAKASKAVDQDGLKNLLVGLEHTYPNSRQEDYQILFNEATGELYVCKKSDVNNGDKTVSAEKFAEGTYYVDEPNVDPKTIKYDTNGNPASVMIDGDEVVLTVSKEVNETDFAIATAKYESDKIEYDQEQNKLNKQTSIYQRQDKQLELKLTRLDSERNALNTELEAVKKVIQDAIDKGFKTFSG